jgi:hypothetical protein
MLLKVVLFAYTVRVSSAAATSRALGQQHVTFIALSGHTAPHFTNIVSTLKDDIVKVFSQVLFICDRQERHTRRFKR